MISSNYSVHLQKAENFRPICGHFRGNAFYPVFAAPLCAIVEENHRPRVRYPIGPLNFSLLTLVLLSLNSLNAMSEV